jgi:hypothetical protein
MNTPMPWTALTGLANGRYYFINRTADGIAASSSLSAATFALLLEHDRADLPLERCALTIVDSTRARDVGFRPNNTVIAQAQWGWSDPIVCDVCGLSGSIDRRRWTAA